MRQSKSDFFKTFWLLIGLAMLATFLVAPLTSAEEMPVPPVTVLLPHYTLTQTPGSLRVTAMMPAESITTPAWTILIIVMPYSDLVASHSET